MGHVSLAIVLGIIIHSLCQIIEAFNLSFRARGTTKGYFRRIFRVRTISNKDVRFSTILRIKFNNADEQGLIRL